MPGVVAVVDSDPGQPFMTEPLLIPFIITVTDVQDVPEPASAMVRGAALLAAGLARRRA